MWRVRACGPEALSDRATTSGTGHRILAPWCYRVSLTNLSPLACHLIGEALTRNCLTASSKRSLSCISSLYGYTPAIYAQGRCDVSCIPHRPAQTSWRAEVSCCAGLALCVLMHLLNSTLFEAVDASCLVPRKCLQLVMQGSCRSVYTAWELQARDVPYDFTRIVKELRKLPPNLICEYSSYSQRNIRLSLEPVAVQRAGEVKGISSF